MGLRINITIIFCTFIDTDGCFLMQAFRFQSESKECLCAFNETNCQNWNCLKISFIFCKSDFAQSCHNKSRIEDCKQCKLTSIKEDELEDKLEVNQANSSHKL